MSAHRIVPASPPCKEGLPGSARTESHSTNWYNDQSRSAKHSYPLTSCQGHPKTDSENHDAVNDCENPYTTSR